MSKEQVKLESEVIEATYRECLLALTGLGVEAGSKDRLSAVRAVTGFMEIARGKRTFYHHLGKPVGAVESGVEGSVEGELRESDEQFAAAVRE